MALVRRYKISKLLEKPMEGVDGEIINFIKSKLENLIPFKWGEKSGNFIDDLFPPSVYYLKSNGECILEKNEDRQSINVKSRAFTALLQDKYMLDEDEMYEILKYLIQDNLKEFNFEFELGKAIPNAFRIEQAFLLDQEKKKRKI